MIHRGGDTLDDVLDVGEIPLMPAAVIF